ncbi:hypothetical protein OUI_0577 [Helicobacter pylori R036d]|uniref:Uncharacterized protein n=1 Tax=Helicobacter pylori R036d TaxID=1145113 RepID=K2LBI2_HELPX|nr:hypothetical protein OUI_0577 [Helicobacter pylori R036d]
MVEWLNDCLNAISTPFLKKRRLRILYLVVFNQWLMVRIYFLMMMRFYLILNDDAFVFI